MYGPIHWGHVGHRQGTHPVRIPCVAPMPKISGQGRLGRSTQPPIHPVQLGMVCPFLNAPNVDKPTALALAIAGVAHMGVAAHLSLLRWISMSTGWATMPVASEGVSPTMSASPRAGSQIPPPMWPTSHPLRGAPCTGRPPRRCVVGLGWLPVRLPVCSRQPARTVTLRT